MNYRDPRWQKKRLEAMSRDDFKCCNCGKAGDTLNVHHKKYHGEPWVTPIDELQTLCEKCHKQLGKHPKGGVYWGEIEDEGDKYPAVVFTHCPHCGGSDCRDKGGYVKCANRQCGVDWLPAEWGANVSIRA